MSPLFEATAGAAAPAVSVNVRGAVRVATSGVVEAAFEELLGAMLGLASVLSDQGRSVEQRGSAGVDQALNKGVVGGDLREFAVAIAVDARVADVRERQLVADPQNAVHGRYHSGELAVREYRLGQE